MAAKPKLSGALRYTTFTELTEAAFVNVGFYAGDELVALFRLKLPTGVEWHETEYLILDAPVEWTAPGKKANVYDAAYRKRQAAVDEQRRRLHLAEALTDGGKIELPGATLEEKADALKDVVGIYLDELWKAFAAVVNGGQSWQDTPDGDLFRRMAAAQARSPAALRFVAAAMDRALRAVEAGAFTGDETAAGSPAEADENTDE